MAKLIRAEAANKRLMKELKETKQLLFETEELHHQGLGADRVGIDFSAPSGGPSSEVEPGAEDKLDDLDKILHSIEALHILEAGGAAVKGSTTPNKNRNSGGSHGQVDDIVMRPSASTGSMPQKSSEDILNDTPDESTSTATANVHSASEHYQLLSSPARRRIKSMTSLLSPESLLCVPAAADSQQQLSDLPPLPPPHHATVKYLRRRDVVMNKHDSVSVDVDIPARHEAAMNRSKSMEEKSTSSLESASSGRSDGPSALSKKGFFFGHKKAVIPIDD